ncbi:MAG: hypothetical protein ACK4TA_09930 [Saprospiraceae bacterium]
MQTKLKIATNRVVFAEYLDNSCIWHDFHWVSSNTLSLAQLFR